MTSVPTEPDTVASTRRPASARPASAAGPLACLSLSMLLSSLGTSIANVGLPAMAQEFGASFQQVQWVVLAYLLSITALIVGIGRLGDLIGRRRLLTAGLLLFTAASALCGLAPDLGLLITARAVQGAGAAAMMALTIAFVGEAVPKAKTGSAMGLLGTMSAVGTALGPSLGGLLVAGPGWRAVFLVMVPLGLAAALLSVRFLPASGPKAMRALKGFDWPGTLLLALALAAYCLAMTVGRGAFGPLNLGLLAAAVLALGLFALVERRSTAPLLRPGMLGDRALRTGLATSAMISTVVMATLVVGPFYLSQGLGLGAAAVGAVMAAGPLVAALTGVPAGRLTDRFGTRRTTIAGLGAMAAGTLTLAGLPAAAGVAGYVVPLVATTAGYALFQTANNTGVMAEVPPDRRGVVSGMLTLSRNLGLVTGASALGAVFVIATGTADLTTAAPEAVAFGMRTSFAVAAGLVLSALAILAASRRSA